MNFFDIAGVDSPEKLNESVSRTIAKVHTSDNRGSDGNQSVYDIEKIAKAALKSKDPQEHLAALKAISEIAHKTHTDPNED